MICDERSEILIRNRRVEVEVEVRQAALLHPRKIRENLYQVHLVVLSGILQHHPGSIKLTSLSAQGLSVQRQRVTFQRPWPSSQIVAPCRRTNLARVQVQPSLVRSRRHATVFFSRPLSPSFLASKTSMVFPTCSKTSCSTRVT